MFILLPSSFVECFWVSAAVTQQARAAPYPHAWGGAEGLWEAHSQGWGLARSELCYPNCGSGLELLVWTQQGDSCPFFCLKVLLR